MAERRAEGVRLLQERELKQVEIARHLKVSEAAVSKWKKTLEEKGSEALQARKATGRPPKMDQEAKQELIEKLKGGAIAAGFPNEQWTQARVKKVIAREFGVNYHQNYISYLLHELGWSVQKPDPRAMERDEERIQDWVDQEWPKSKKRAEARRRNRV